MGIPVRPRRLLALEAATGVVLTTSMFDLAALPFGNERRKDRAAAPPFLVETLNQEVSLHPRDTRSRLLGDDRTVGDDILWDALTGLFTADNSGHTCSNSP